MTSLPLPWPVTFALSTASDGHDRVTGFTADLPGGNISWHTGVGSLVEVRPRDPMGGGRARCES